MPLSMSSGGQVFRSIHVNGISQKNRKCQICPKTGKNGNFKHVKNLEKRKSEMCQKSGVTIASKYRTF